MGKAGRRAVGAKPKPAKRLPPKAAQTAAPNRRGKPAVVADRPLIAAAQPAVQTGSGTGGRARRRRLWAGARPHVAAVAKGRGVAAPALGAVVAGVGRLGSLPEAWAAKPPPRRKVVAARPAVKLAGRRHAAKPPLDGARRRPAAHQPLGARFPRRKAGLGAVAASDGGQTAFSPAKKRGRPQESRHLAIQG